MLSLRGPREPTSDGWFQSAVAKVNEALEKARAPAQALAGQEWVVATLQNGPNGDMTYQLHGPYGILLSCEERQAIWDILASHKLRFMEGKEDIEAIKSLPGDLADIVASYCAGSSGDPAIFRLDPATGETETVARLVNQNPRNHQDTNSLRTGNLLRQEYEPTVEIDLKTIMGSVTSYHAKRSDTVQNIKDYLMAMFSIVEPRRIKLFHRSGRPLPNEVTCEDLWLPQFKFSMQGDPVLCFVLVKLGAKTALWS